MFPNSFIAKLMSTFGILNKNIYICELHFQYAVGSFNKYLFYSFTCWAPCGALGEKQHSLSPEGA